MGKAVKMPIGLPNKIGRGVGRKRKKRIIEAILDERNEPAMVKRYVDGYRKMPETTDEIEVAETATKLLLKKLEDT